MYYKIIFFIGVCLLAFQTRAQKIHVEGGFLKDSVSIGERVEFYLWARYRQDYTVLFPDSTYNFSPLEWIDKRFFPTQTSDSMSYDSVVYSMATYELDSVQFLSLPVFLVQKSDCVRVYSQVDTIFLNFSTRHISDAELPTTKLKTDIEYQAVHLSFNFFLTSLIIGIIGLTMGTLWFIFRKKIYVFFRAKKLQRKHKKFIHEFDQAVAQYTNKNLPIYAEHALILWKQYMESLLYAPFSTFTSKDIYQHTPNKDLHKSLTWIDGIIYGDKHPTTNPFIELRSFSEDLYYTEQEQMQKT